MGKHSAKVNSSSVIKLFLQYGYKYLTLDDFEISISKGEIVLKFIKYLTHKPTCIRCPKLYITLRCGQTVMGCEYKRGDRYIDTLRQDEDIKYGYSTCGLSPISFSIYIYHKQMGTKRSLQLYNQFVKKIESPKGLNYLQIQYMNIKRIGKLLEILKRLYPF